jgi:hypothetical protein
MFHCPRQTALEERIAELERRREALYMMVLDGQRRRFQEANVAVHRHETVQEDNHQKRKAETSFEGAPKSRKSSRTHWEVDLTRITLGFYAAKFSSEAPEVMSKTLNFRTTRSSWALRRYFRYFMNLMLMQRRTGKCLKHFGSYQELLLGQLIATLAYCTYLNSSNHMQLSLRRRS